MLPYKIILDDPDNCEVKGVTLVIFPQKRFGTQLKVEDKPIRNFPGGLEEARWDLKDSKGDFVHRGFYLVVINAHVGPKGKDKPIENTCTDFLNVKVPE